jgi:predicted ATPase/transcriptional regulator with XRE-family HTH domain
VEGRSAAEASFAVQLRRLRAEAGLTQEALAERAGLSVRGLRYLERGIRRPYPATILRLAEALSLPGASQALGSSLRNSSRGRSSGQPFVAPPIPTGPIIGRERDLEGVVGLLRRPQLRLLTIAGPGGVGKTRLALESARQLVVATGTPAVWVPLEAVMDPALVPAAVARAAGVTPGSSRPLLEVLMEGLEEHILLLDNMEQLLGAGTFVSSLVSSCPSLTVIVTSRVPLGLYSEQLYWLEPLTVPDAHPASAQPPDVHVVALNPAVDLFLRRAQAVDPHFRLTPANVDAVATICRRLEGFPLAIELAAARTRLLPPPDLSSRLSSRLGLLKGLAVDAPERHRTMRAAIAWSYDLLEKPLRPLFRFLSVFEEGASLSSVEALLAAHPLDSDHDAMESLDVLVRSSLVQMENPATHEARVRMHEMVREYGLEECVVHGEEALARSWHAHHFLALAVEAERRFYGPDSTTWLNRLELENANLRAALDWFGHHTRHGDGLRMAAALAWFWYVRGHSAAGLRRLETFLTGCPPDTDTGSRIHALLGAGQLAQTQGDYGAARGLLEESIQLAGHANDPQLAAALLAAGFVARIQEDYDAATTLLEEARSRAATAEPAFIEAAVYHHLGCVAVEADHDLPRARRLLDASLMMYRQRGMVRFEALVVMSIADVAMADGSPREAAELLERSLALLAQCGERLAVPGALDAVAQLVFISSQELPNGVRLAAAADHLREISGIKTWPVTERRRTQALARARAILSADTYQDCWDDGRAASMEHAIEEARHQARRLGSGR